MNRRNQFVVVLMLVCLGALWGVFVQGRQLTRLRNEQHQRLAELAGSPTNEAPPAPVANAPETAHASPELLRLRNEVARFTERSRDLAAARAENERLRVQLAARGTNASAGTGPLAGFMRKSEARMAGYGTPENTIQSFLWAMQNRDFTNLLQALTPSEAQELETSIRGSGQATEQFFQGFAPLVGLRILSREQLPDGGIHMSLEMGPGIPDLPAMEVNFRLINGQWKMEMPH